MGDETTRPAWGWPLQALSGLALVVLGGIHVWTQHFSGQGLLDYQHVVAWLRQPWAFVMENVFLGIVVAHALLGIRAVLFDLGLSLSTERRLTRMLAAVAVVLFLYGVGLTWIVAHH